MRQIRTSAGQAPSVRTATDGSLALAPEWIRRQVLRLDRRGVHPLMCLPHEGVHVSAPYADDALSRPVQPVQVHESHARSGHLDLSAPAQKGPPDMAGQNTVASSG